MPPLCGITRRQDTQPQDPSSAAWTAMLTEIHASALCIWIKEWNKHQNRADIGRIRFCRISRLNSNQKRWPVSAQIVHSCPKNVFSPFNGHFCNKAKRTGTHAWNIAHIKASKTIEKKSGCKRYYIEYQISNCSIYLDLFGSYVSKRLGWTRPGAYPPPLAASCRNTSEIQFLLYFYLSIIGSRAVSAA